MLSKVIHVNNLAELSQLHVMYRLCDNLNSFEPKVMTVTQSFLLIM